MRIALRIEVSTLAGAHEGVTGLLRLLDEYQVKGNFLFSLGTDYSTHPLRKLIPESLLKQLPSPVIKKKALDNLRAVSNAGHEIGISSYTPWLWKSDAAFRSEPWTRYQFQHSIEAFEGIFGKKPLLHGAAGWQLNEHLLKLEEEYGFQYAADVRGRNAFLPELQGVKSTCPQLPTTLPTLYELLTRKNLTEENLHQYLYAECQRVLPTGEVFSLGAEREGISMLPVIEKLLVMWKGGQWEIKTFSELFEPLQEVELKRHQIGWDEPEDGSAHQAMQSIIINDN